MEYVGQEAERCGWLLVGKEPTERGGEYFSHCIPFNDFHVPVTLCLDQNPRTKETDLVLLELSVVESHLSLPYRSFFKKLNAPM